MRMVFLLAATAALAACNETELPSNQGNEQVNAVQPSADAGGNDASEALPMNAAVPRDTSNPIGPPPDDPKQCGADKYQWLVGQPRSRIPEQPGGARWRIACTTCPVTMDYSPQRMNIFYDEESEIVETVKCG